MVAEDARFCTHRGVDFSELRNAIEDADDLSEMRGGSTIAQQTAKNLFLWPGRSVVRKALEFPLALWLDLVLGKRRLMEIYLNIAEWGPNGEFGAEAAARRAFNKPARDLSAREAALLAAILPNPAPPQRRQAGPGGAPARRESTRGGRAGPARSRTVSGGKYSRNQGLALVGTILYKRAFSRILRDRPP
jgi:monofunctional biosynthetic peptidoglycan transglycosylase